MFPLLIYLSIDRVEIEMNEKRKTKKDKKCRKLIFLWIPVGRKMAFCN